MPSRNVSFAFTDDVILLVKSSRDQAAARIALTSPSYGLSLDQVQSSILCPLNALLQELSKLNLCEVITCMNRRNSKLSRFLPQRHPSHVIKFLIVPFSLF
jgi:hypothetical protein